ncbi:MAG: hypothetical protein JXR95_04510 [Deltaproteobacteria bacterium]|nr:hypothetical protein [Deltaproteobacteria bacterium]
MKKIIILFSLFFTVSNISCSEKKSVTEKSPAPSQFNFTTTTQENLSLVIENVGDVTVKSSIPGKAVVTVEKVAVSHSRKKAAELLDKIISTPEKTREGIIKYRPKFPEISSSEKVTTNASFLVPLNRSIPVNVAMAKGKLTVRGIIGTLSAVLTKDSSAEINSFSGSIELSCQNGNVFAGNKISSGKISTLKGNITLKLREKSLKGDIELKSTTGDISLQLLNNPEYSIEINSKAKIVNKSSTIKLPNGRKSGNKFFLKVTTSGTVTIMPDLW